MLIRQILAVFRKDVRSELRTRYALSTIGMFVLTSVALVAFATREQQLSREVSAALFWIVLFFSATTGLARSFVAEEERGTAVLLRISASATAVFFGKMLFNATGSLAMASSTTILSAIIARSRTRGALFPILAFPILLPLVVAGVELVEHALRGTSFVYAWNGIAILSSYTVVVSTVSLFLFDFVWKD
jgi:heme exporter protein B